MAAPSKPHSITKAPSYQEVPLIVIPRQIVPLPAEFSSIPMKLTCNVCHTEIWTATEEKCNLMLLLNAAAFCKWGVCALCCCQDVEHKCPNCNAFLGKYSASG
ncbi:lipopolysaccharide-induced tumor necrosis factor-alpha factor homolog [Folsomia candida]|uniref:lipopolysaccharide-induced tumor necrosis factor-alpha factor homolog n=1 Tax=Folsomia candida TaxID=158441 RepID=UPI001604D574|nr:lipopolysaccharide-induced tumor necrosis factor-alpha factor homolog [Folsomia candida]XP_035701800.1 lipopolysaccharide-induced tumor necrosis factor-alpha factor homolog [Folsomia candida]